MALEVKEDALEEAICLYRRGLTGQAEGLCTAMLGRAPLRPQALHLLGLIAAREGRTREALERLRAAVQAAPAVADFHNSLGIALAERGSVELALDSFRRALRLRPDYVDAQCNVGLAQEQAGKLPEAAEAYRQAVRLSPNAPDPRYNLGNALRKLGRLAEAEGEYREAIRLDPGRAAAHSGLGSTLAAQGRAEEATACDRATLALCPDSPAPYSALLHGLHFSPGESPQSIFEAHLDWGRRHGEPFYPREQRRDELVHPSLAPFLHAGSAPGTGHAFSNSSQPRRKLCVGYVSPDFRQHPVARFFEPILANHSPDSFDVFCYSSVAHPDATTERLRCYPSRWRNIRGATDAAAAELIRADRIDILVDLAGHLAGNRLPLFARKPAPVQVTYIGYPDTTGLATMDYKITDSIHDPPGLTERYYTEKLIRLPSCCWCYRPGDDAPDVNRLPAETTKFVTFGALNQLVKATPAVLALWARVLESVPGSRLTALVPAGAEQDTAVRARFQDAGIAPSRLVLVGRRPRRHYLELYHKVDISLDTFPFNGHTTTLDALWMGVPTVTLAGQTHVQRAGASVLSAAGLADLIALTPQQYVDAAVRLASDVPKLAELRRELRERVRASPLRDEAGLTRRVEAAYRMMVEGA